MFLLFRWIIVYTVSTTWIVTEAIEKAGTYVSVEVDVGDACGTGNEKLNVQLGTDEEFEKITQESELRELLTRKMYEALTKSGCSLTALNDAIIDIKTDVGRAAPEITEPTVLDMCGNGKHNCHQNATCNNTRAGFNCSCKDGYTGDGRNCTVIDMCGNGDHNCHPNATCNNTQGRFNCTCKDGYTGNGINCTVMDICGNGEHNCHPNATCNNAKSGFNCTCKDGYTGNGINCTVIDMCGNGDHNCHPNATCNDTQTGFNCICKDGYTGDGTNCTDVDECTTGENKCSSVKTCINIEGSYLCECYRGFLYVGLTCKDINECDNASACHPQANCENAEGTFTCQCNNGYSGDGKICEEPIPKNSSPTTITGNSSQSCNESKKIFSSRCVEIANASICQTGQLFVFTLNSTRTISNITSTPDGECSEFKLNYKENSTADFKNYTETATGNTLSFEPYLRAMKLKIYHKNITDCNITVYGC